MMPLKTLAQPLRPFTSPSRKGVLIGSLVLVVALVGFGFRAIAPTDATATPEQPADSVTTLPDRSLYQLGSTWTDQGGATVRLTDLRGRPQLVAMVFTRCGYACPRIVQDMKKILKGLPDDRGLGVGVTLISIDPDNDTPDELRHFAEMHDLPADQWTLLRSKDDAVRELAAVLGVRYKQEANGQFAHSNTITLLDAEGVLVHQQEGLGDDPTESIRTLSALLER